MEISRETVRMAVMLTGILVLVSYVFGIYRMASPNDLWGGIPVSWRKLNTATMFVAAAGFLMAYWFLLYKWDAKAVESIQWPWGSGQEGGHARLMLAFMLITIPSMFWLETTILHLKLDSNWTQWLVMGNLWLACLGNILLGLLAWSALKQGVGAYAFIPLLGSVMLGLQVIVNDGILWNLKYPW
jgi:hypothetical protein